MLENTRENLVGSLLIACIAVFLVVLGLRVRRGTARLGLGEMLRRQKVMPARFAPGWARRWAGRRAMPRARLQR